MLATCKLFHAAGGTRRLKLVHRLLDAPFGLTTDEIAHSSTSLDLSNRELGADVSGVCDALRAGAMAGCREVHLNGNAMKAAGVQALCEAISAGALAHCTFLALYKNQIDDVGAMALGAVLRAGRLRAASTRTRLAAPASRRWRPRRATARSPRSEARRSARMRSATPAPSSWPGASCGSFASVKYLVLERNAIGERGMRALAGAIFCGAFAAVPDGAVPQQDGAPHLPRVQPGAREAGARGARRRVGIGAAGRAPWGRRNFSLVSAAGIVGGRGPCFE